MSHAVCCCGGDGPTITCDGGTLPANPCIIVTFEGITGTTCPVQFATSIEGVVTALDYNGVIRVDGYGSHSPIDSPQLGGFGSHSISCVYPGSGDGLPCPTSCGTSGTATGVASLTVVLQCRPDGEIGVRSLALDALHIADSCGGRRPSSTSIFLFSRGSGATPARLNTPLSNQTSAACLAYTIASAGSGDPNTYPLSITGTATVNVVAGPCPSRMMARVGRSGRAGSAVTPARVWSLREMIVAYTQARLSGRGAAPEVIEERRRSCFGGEGEPPCPMLRGEPGRRFCGACGCGARREALLDPDPETGRSKLEFVKLRCPLKRPGFTNA